MQVTFSDIDAAVSEMKAKAFRRVRELEMAQDMLSCAYDPHYPLRECGELVLAREVYEFWCAISAQLNDGLDIPF